MFVQKSTVPLVTVNGLAPDPGRRSKTPSHQSLELQSDLHGFFLGGCIIFNAQTWVQLGAIFPAIWIREAQKTRGEVGRERERNVTATKRGAEARVWEWSGVHVIAVILL